MYGYNLKLGSARRGLPARDQLRAFWRLLTTTSPLLDDEGDPVLDSNDEVIYEQSSSLTDIIGIPISAYSLLDPYWQDFFFDDPTTPKTTVTAADIIADPNINIPGGNVFYSSSRDIIAIYGTSPAESAERQLWRYLFGTVFEPLYIDGVSLSLDGLSIYIEV